MGPDGLPLQHARRLLQSLRHEGFASNVACAKNALWRACAHTKAAQATADGKSARRVCNSSQPPMRPFDLPTMSSARHDADQHLDTPSRRGDVLKLYTPPMVLGSGIGGGMR